MAATPSHIVRVNATTRVSHRVSTTGLMHTIDFHMVVNTFFEQQDVIDMTSYPPRPSDSDSDSDEENRELEWNKFMRSIRGKLCPLTCPCRRLEASRRQDGTNTKGKTIKNTKRAPQPPVPAQGSFTCSRCGTFGTPLRRCTLCGTASFGCHMSTMARARRCRFSTTTSMSMSVHGETLGEPL